MTRWIDDQFNKRALRAIYRLSPFALEGDLQDFEHPWKKGVISCLICAAHRPAALTDILTDIEQQDIPHDKLELVVLNNGGGREVVSVIESFQKNLSIVYRELKTARTELGIIRNMTAAVASGEFLLFMDDDTRLLQKSFLAKIFRLFGQFAPDVLMPQGNALYGLLKERCDFLDEYSFATRCLIVHAPFFRRMKGFRNITAFDDMDLGLRTVATGGKILITDEINYHHPPLHFKTLDKPLALGQSLFELRKVYSWPFWMVVYLHALRFLALGLVAGKYRGLFQLSLGAFLAPFQKRKHRYIKGSHGH